MSPIAAIDVVVVPTGAVDVQSVGVQGPPGVPGPAGPAGPTGPPGPAGTGDVTGPASATDGAAALFNGTTGKLLKNGATALGLDSGGTVHLGSPSTPIIIENTVNAGGTLKADAVAIGTNPAQSGAIRLANAQEIRARNAANTADLTVLQIGGDDYVKFGSTIGTGLSLICQAAGAVLWQFGGAIQFFLTQSAFSSYTTNATDLGQTTNRFRSLFLGTRVNLTETAAPAAPAANEANLWLQDNGAGKSQLMIQFATGAPIAIATQV